MQIQGTVIQLPIACPKWQLGQAMCCITRSRIFKERPRQAALSSPHARTYVPLPPSYTSPPDAPRPPLSERQPVRRFRSTGTHAHPSGHSLALVRRVRPPACRICARPPTLACTRPRRPCSMHARMHTHTTYAATCWVKACRVETKPEWSDGGRCKMGESRGR